MRLITEGLLREKSRSFQKVGTPSSRYLVDRAEDARLSVFLSHSHRDKELAQGFIEFLAERGVRVYVDWNDSTMPRITSGETARKIKQRIQQLDLFFFLATRNGLNSKWCPWELGVADSSKDWDRITIIPVADPSRQFEGNEYLQVYRHLELDIDGKAYIFEPGLSRIGEGQILKTASASTSKKPLVDYLREYAGGRADD